MLAYIHIMFHSKLFSFTFEIVHVFRIKLKRKFSHISTRFSNLGMYTNDIPVSVSVYEILWCDSSKRVLFRGTLLFLTTFVQNELQSSCFFISIFVNVWINVLNPSREYHDELLRISMVDNSYMYLFLSRGAFPRTYLIPQK